MPQVVTANRLTDGIVVFLGPDGRWVEQLRQAEPLGDKQATEAALARANADILANKVVDVFAFDVTVSGSEIEAKHIRDQIRARGPTVHPDHGKQAEAR